MVDLMNLLAAATGHIEIEGCFGDFSEEEASLGLARRWRNSCSGYLSSLQQPVGLYAYSEHSHALQYADNHVKDPDGPDTLLDHIRH